MHTTGEISEPYQNAISKRKDETNQSDEYSKKRKSNQMNVERKDGPASPEASAKMPDQLDIWLSIFSQWSSKERHVALDALVSNGVCEVQQLRHMLSLIEPLLQRDFISLLPKELSLKVLRLLTPPDLLQAAQTCRYWNILCEDSLMWRDKCIEEGILDQSDVQDYLDQAPSSLLSPSSSPRAVSASYFKTTYLRHKKVEYNWRYGIFSFRNQRDGYFSERAEINGQCGTGTGPGTSVTMPKDRNRKRPQLKEVLYLKGHDDHVVTCLQFNPTSNIIVSGSDDNTLKVWCSLSGRLLRTLTGHSGGVWSSQLSSDNIVISGSTDRTLRVWDALSGDCLHTLYGHTSTVRCLALHSKRVVSGSRDATLRAWHIETGECEHVLVGHLAAVRCVQYNGNLCVSGAYDYTVRVWKVETEHCLHVLEGHSNRVYSLQFDGENIVSGSLDTTIRVWSASEGKLKHTLMGHQSLTSGMQLRKNILVSGNADSTVKVWDINTGQCLQTLSGAFKHSSAVTCLQFNTSFVITSSDDGTVKLWDLKTGEFIRNLITLPSGGSGGVVWRIRASDTTLVCAVGSRNGTEETKLLVLDFETAYSIDQDLRSFFNPSQSDESMEPSENAINSVRWNESEQIDYGDVDLRRPINSSANYMLEPMSQPFVRAEEEEERPIAPPPPPPTPIPSTSQPISSSISNNSLSSLVSSVSTSSAGCQHLGENPLSQSASEASLSRTQTEEMSSSRPIDVEDKAVVDQAACDDQSKELPQPNSMDVDR